MTAVASLLNKERQVTLADAAIFDRHDYCFDNRSLKVGSDEGSITFDSSVRGWIRRLAPPHWRTGLLAGSRDAAIRSAHVALTMGLAAHEGVVWLTRFEDLVLADNKLLQAQVAARHEVATPRTVVCSQAGDIPDSLGERLVVKPLGSSQYRAQGKTRVVFAQAIARQNLMRLPLHGAPFLVQELVPAEQHLRVVTVRNRCWIASLDASDTSLDWRADDSSHEAFVLSEDQDVSEQAIKIANGLKLGYSSQDWIVNSGGKWLLDVNPAGQWLFLPEPIGSEVSEAIATWLAEGGH